MRHLDAVQLADVHGMDQAVAEAADDLRKLVEHAALRYVDVDEVRATADLTQGILLTAEWDRLNLASVLALAVVRLVRKGAIVRGKR